MEFKELLSLVTAHFPRTQDCVGRGGDLAVDPMCRLITLTTDIMSPS